MERLSEGSPYSVSTVPLRAGPSSSLHSPPSPSSPCPLHSASVHVTEFSYLTNPAPVGKGGGWNGGGGREVTFCGDYLSPMKLRELSGERDLSNVSYLEVCVNSQNSSLGNFGSSLPALEELRCVESVVPCVRDLGTSLSGLVVLWLPQCQLRDLDGLPALTALRELYIAFNEVRDVSVAAMLPCLQLLDIESNLVSEGDQLGYLRLCSQLSSLTLSGNPLAQHITAEQGGETGYRAAVVKAIPHLKVLDDVLVTEQPSPLPSPRPSPLATGLSSQSIGFGRLGSSWGGERSEPHDRVSPLPARPRTALSPGRGGRVSPVEDDSSELTHGLSQVICGNPVRALKARRRHGLTSQSAVVVTSPPSSARSPPPSLDALMEELSITTATSIEDLSQQPDHLPPSPSPSPPASSSQQHRRLPTPPARPHSVADFRHRRYRRAALPTVSRSLSDGTPPFHPPSSTHRLNTHPHTSHPHT